ncbi:hypothetical protein ACVIGB_000095 [Bradyrhizobium sp. USDA 4341]
MHAGRRRAAFLAAQATLVTLPPAPAWAAASGSVETSLVSFAVALAVAVAGLFILASGLSRIAGGTVVKKLGIFGALARFGWRGDADAGEARIRRATTAIMLGAALLGLPDFFGMGVLSQARILYDQAQSSIRAPAGPSAVTIKEKVTTYIDGSGGDSTSTGKWLGLPWWALSLVGLILLITLLARLAANDESGPSASTIGGAPRASPEFASGSLGPFEGPTTEGGSGASAGTVRRRGLLEQIIDVMERIKMGIRRLMAGLKTQAKLLEEKTEGLRGRLRPVTDFAAAQIGQAARIVADRDDGGSGLPRARDAGDREGSLAAAHAQMFAERIGSTLQLHGADLEGLLARAFNTTPKRIKSDLFRLGASGAPQDWIKVMSAGSGRDWVLAEAGMDPLLHRFDAAIAFDEIDWYATLSPVEARLIAMPFAIVPAEARAVRLIRVRDPMAADFVAALGEPPDEYKDAVWSFVDLPAQTARHIFSTTRRDRWSIAPDAPEDDTLVVKIARGSLTVVSGQDELTGYLASEDVRPLRLLVAVIPGGALANLGVTIEDVTPFETVEEPLR